MELGGMEKASGTAENESEGMDGRQVREENWELLFATSQG